MLSLTGCQEASSESSDTTLIQRARLVGNENLKLKQELEQKNEKITQLEAQIEQINAENEQASIESGETNLRIMLLMAEAQKNNESLLQENEKLKAEIEKLKGQ